MFRHHHLHYFYIRHLRSVLFPFQWYLTSAGNILISNKTRKNTELPTANTRNPVGGVKYRLQVSAFSFQKYFVNFWISGGNKMPTRCNRGFYCRSYCLLNINQHPANRTHNPQLHTRPATWKNRSTKYHRQQPLYNTLELLMMGIVMPETCWASNKICNKNLCCI